MATRAWTLSFTGVCCSIVLAVNCPIRQVDLGMLRCHDKRSANVCSTAMTSKCQIARLANNPSNTVHWILLGCVNNDQKLSFGEPQCFHFSGRIGSPSFLLISNSPNSICSFAARDCESQSSLRCLSCQRHEPAETNSTSRLASSLPYNPAIGALSGTSESSNALVNAASNVADHAKICCSLLRR